MRVLLHETSSLNKRLRHYSKDKSRSNVREAMGLENTHGIFVLARICVLTNAIVSQEDTTECREKFQPFDQLQRIAKHIRLVRK